MGRIEVKPCPLCAAESAKVSPHIDRDAFDVDCRRCGSFSITGTLYAIGKIPTELKPQLSAYTRQCTESNQQPEILDTLNLGSLAGRIGTVRPNERVDKLLVIFGARSSHPGAAAQFSPEWDYPLIHAINPQETSFHRNALIAADYVELVNEDTVIVTHKGWERLESLTRDSLTNPQSEDQAMHRGKEWDAFICHASEDKTTVVEPLVGALTARGLRVWYDRMVLTIGDSLRRKIDEGLVNSRFGIVVLSRSFFGKGWPERELDGLVQKEIGGRKVILPIWHGVTHDDVASYSLPLADKVAGSTHMGIEDLAVELLRAMNAAPASSATTNRADSSSSRLADASKRALVLEKWVDINYPRDIGLIRQLEAEGYKAKWCFDRDVPRVVDIQGWEIVYLDAGKGQLTILKLRDRPDNQTLVKKREPTGGS